MRLSHCSGRANCFLSKFNRKPDRNSLGNWIIGAARIEQEQVYLPSVGAVITDLDLDTMCTVENGDGRQMYVHKEASLIRMLAVPVVRVSKRRRHYSSQE